MRTLIILVAVLCGCAERPSVGITISNTPEPIESCGRKVGPC